MPYKDLEARIVASRRYYQANKEKILQRVRERYQAKRPPRHSPGIATTDPPAYQRQWAQANPKKTRDYSRRYYLKSYGLTQDRYNSILQEQGGICALCSKDDPTSFGRKLNIDHDHVTGKVRGLLCHAHNTGLGKLGDSIEGLMRAVDYLRRNL